MPAKRQRPSRAGFDARDVFSEGNYRTAAKQRHQAHAVQASVGSLSMNTKEIYTAPSKRVCLGGPFFQEPKSIILEGLPCRLGPVRVRGHSEKIGNALDPCFRDTIRHLQEDGPTARRAQRHASDRAYFVNFATLARGSYFVNFVDFVTYVSQNLALGLFLPLEGRNGFFSAVSCCFRALAA